VAQDASLRRPPIAFQQEFWSSEEPEWSAFVKKGVLPENLAGVR